jgi:phosphoribosyl 1,2-cyclic phosphate phosphodiesterase
MAEVLRITVLGSGTSSGVPTIGCGCATCSSIDPRDNRLRPSILVEYGGKNVLIDTTPDFRAQALRAGIGRVDAILYTHAHADHILGLDDAAAQLPQKMSIPAYGTEGRSTLCGAFSLRVRSEPSQSSAPRGPVHHHGRALRPVWAAGGPDPLDACRGVTLGFRFGDAAYLTDHSDIPEESKPLLQNLDLFLDALPVIRPFVVAQSLESANNWPGPRASLISVTIYRVKPGLHFHQKFASV